MMHVPATHAPSLDGCPLTGYPGVVVGVYAGAGRAVEEEGVGVCGGDIDDCCTAWEERTDACAQRCAYCPGVIGGEVGEGYGG